MFYILGKKHKITKNVNYLHTKTHKVSKHLTTCVIILTGFA